MKNINTLQLQDKSSPDNDIKSLVTHETIKQNTDDRGIGFLNDIGSDVDVDPVQASGVSSQVMRLVFPKSSYSFDARQRRVCFWGYGSGIETQFFIEVDALKRLCPEMIDTEAGFLQAFDDARKQILEVAVKVSVNDVNSHFSYILEAADF